MIYILSNIFFGHPKLYKHQIDYFDNYFLPFINKNKPKKIIIDGNLFYNTHSISFSLLNKIKEIFSTINCPVEMAGNEYCFYSIKNFTDIEIEYIKFEYELEPFSLFHFSKDNNEKIGFYAVKDKTTKFIENKFSPRFVEQNIESLEDLNVEITKDFIDLTINSELILKPEFKNKIDIFLNNNTFNNVFYTEKKVEIEKVKMKNNDIRSILTDNINDDLKDELKEIFTIYDEKNHNL